MAETKVSVVSGTYNRLRLLQRMVSSVRASIGSIPYEIVLVDGGSTDGTIGWCREQPDVVLIEQGELLGAVKAFNAGCMAAHGEYVVILNDDIEVRGHTLALASSTLDRAYGVGQVAFENIVTGNDPTRRPYGHAYGYLYGQCCMVRRWLGDLVGWWGEGYHTYGGDTRLSMMLWERGWPTVKVPGCAITDHVTEDDLRVQRKSLLKLESGGNRDTQLFHKRWHERLPKPTRWIPACREILQEKARDHRLSVVRFKLVPSNTKARMGLIDAFAAYGTANQYNQSHIIKKQGIPAFQTAIIDAANQHTPDILLLQVHSNHLNVYPDTLRTIRKRHPDMLILNFDGDWRTELSDVNLRIAAAVDWQMVSTPALFERYYMHDVHNLIWWLNGFESIYGTVPRKPGDTDVAFLANLYKDDSFPESAIRHWAARTLVRDGINLKLYGGGWGRVGLEAGYTVEDHKQNTRIYASAKMALSISATRTQYGYTSDRLFMITASGCPVLLQQFSGMEELGYIDGETCIAWASMEELLDKTKYYLEHAEERETIGAAGKSMTHARHSYAARVRDLLDLL